MIAQNHQRNGVKLKKLHKLAVYMIIDSFSANYFDNLFFRQLNNVNLMFGKFEMEMIK